HLGQVDEVRLLPRQERADGTGRLAAVGTDLLRPACAGVALTRRRRTGRIADVVIPAQAPRTQLWPAPGGEARRVEQVHLEVELAAPRVEQQPRLRRRQRARAVDGSQVLRENDAALQLWKPFVGTACQVDART